MSTKNKRTRRRSISTDDVVHIAPNKSEPSKETISLARHFFAMNKESNSAASLARSLKAQLMESMDNEGVTSFRDVDAGITTSLCTPERQVVDTESLRKLVDEDTFLLIVSASQANVKEHVGQTVLNNCLVPKTGNRSVTVKSIS